MIIKFILKGSLLTYLFSTNILFFGECHHSILGDSPKFTFFFKLKKIKIKK
jgi:hypothetical protein